MPGCYTNAAFAAGALVTAPTRLELEYPKNVDKKGNELPLQIEGHVCTSEDFIIKINVMGKSQAYGGLDDDNGEWEICSFENRRAVKLRLHPGHVVENGALSVAMEGPIFQIQPSHAISEISTGDTVGAPFVHETDEPIADDGATAMTSFQRAAEISLSTRRGECILKEFQLGTDEEGGELEAGQYTLVFSSAGLPDAHIRVSLKAKGRKK
jgi:hypothetical protein